MEFGHATSIIQSLSRAVTVICIASLTFINLFQLSHGKSNLRMCISVEVVGHLCTSVHKYYELVGILFSDLLTDSLIVSFKATVTLHFTTDIK